MMTFKNVMSNISEAFTKGGYDFATSGIEVVINKRLTKTLGRCISKSVNGISTPYKIEISAELLETADDQTIKDVLYHETAHALVGLETGEKHGHDEIFRQMCKRIGTNNDKASTSVTRIVEDNKIYKYFIFCNKCNKIVAKYHRAGKVIKNVDYYQCSLCNTNSLKIIQNF